MLKKHYFLLFIFSDSQGVLVTTVEAEEKISQPSENGGLSEVVDTYPLQINDDETLNFFTEEDREEYVRLIINPKQRHVNKMREKEISRTTFYNKFVGYNPLTSNWSFASSYTLSTSKNISFTTGYTYDGLSTNLTVSRSNGVSINLPANRRRSSRLAGRADVTVAKVEVEYYNGVTVLRRFNLLRTRSVRNFTNYVSYR